MASLIVENMQLEVEGRLLLLNDVGKELRVVLVVFAIVGVRVYGVPIEPAELLLVTLVSASVAPVRSTPVVVIATVGATVFVVIVVIAITVIVVAGASAVVVVAAVAVASVAAPLAIAAALLSVEAAILGLGGLRLRVAILFRLTVLSPVLILATRLVLTP